jgi:hypothetical protein
MSRQKVIDGLRDAVSGNLSRVTIEGQVWQRTSADPNPIPPFYCSRTLLGFAGGPDLNRITLQMPGRYHDSNQIVLCEMNAARTDDDIKRWNKLAAELSRVWIELNPLKRP